MLQVVGLPAGAPTDWTVEQRRQVTLETARLINQLAAQHLAALAAFDAADGARAEGHRTTGDWLSKTTRTDKGGALVATARDLRDHLPLTADALAEGLISMDHVRAIRGGRRIMGKDFDGIEDVVVDYAKRTTPKALRNLVDQLIQQYSPDGSDDDAECTRAKRKLFLDRGLDGWWHLQGLLDPATGEKLKTALDVLGQPAGPDDDRRPAARRCDALAELAERGLDPDRTGHGYTTITMTPEQAEHHLGVSWPSGLLASPTDVAVETCSTDVAYLLKDPITWQPLVVGFAERFATPAQRRALAVRDGAGCAHPGCTVPVWRTIAHHIVAWDQGGPSDLPNLVLLCRYHHREVHRGTLRVVFQDGRATTIRGDRAPP